MIKPRNQNLFKVSQKLLNVSPHADYWMCRPIFNLASCGRMKMCVLPWVSDIMCHLGDLAGCSNSTQMCINLAAREGLNLSVFVTSQDFHQLSFDHISSSETESTEHLRIYIRFAVDWHHFCLNRAIDKNTHSVANRPYDGRRVVVGLQHISHRPYDGKRVVMGL